MTKSANFTILIVDDNDNNLYTLRTLINQYLDAEVLEASSGMEAMDIALGDQAVDIIVLDVQMPEMDGFQTASMLKIRKKTQDIPIIFLTAAFKAHEFQQKGYEVGGVDYLLKPIDDNLLINKISTYIRLIEKERDMNVLLEAKVIERTQELAKAKQYVEKIINTMGEALLVLNADGVIRDANPSACKLLAYSLDNLKGMGIGEVFEEENQEKAAAFMGTWLEALIRSGVLTSIEASFIASDQRRIPILFSRTVAMGDDDQVEAIICIAKDMTGYQKIDDDD
ncbi:MAG: response regulator [Methylococcales bacterium]|jgi:PAS domain S-box-containing protein|nr:response regulator [Methylococcales bacterium]